MKKDILFLPGTASGETDLTPNTSIQEAQVAEVIREEMEGLTVYVKGNDFHSGIVFKAFGLYYGILIPYPSVRFPPRMADILSISQDKETVVNTVKSKLWDLSDT